MPRRKWSMTGTAGWDFGAKVTWEWLPYSTVIYFYSMPRNPTAVWSWKKGDSCRRISLYIRTLNQQPVAVFTTGIQLLAVDIEPGKVGHKVALEKQYRFIRNYASGVHCSTWSLGIYIFRSLSSMGHIYIRIYIWGCSYTPPIPDVTSRNITSIELQHL